MAEKIMMFEPYRSLFVVRVTTRKGTQDFSYDVNIGLPKDKELFLGFDQSGTQTGFCICDKELRPYCFIDIINKGLPSSYLYNEMMGYFLGNICRNCNIKIVAIEKPWGGKKYSRFKLNELFGFMKHLKLTIPEWNSAILGEVYPQQWRSVFLTSQDYKGRFTKDKVKDAVREEVCIRNPWVKSYAYKYKKVPDSLEAYGIICGFVTKNFNEFGGLKVNKTMSKKNYTIYNKLIKCNIDKIKETLSEEQSFYDKLLEEYGDGGIVAIANKRGLQVMDYSFEMSEKENMERACSMSEKAIVVPIPFSNLYSSYMWDSGEVIGKGDAYFLIGFRING